MVGVFARQTNIHTCEPYVYVYLPVLYMFYILHANFTNLIRNYACMHWNIHTYVHICIVHIYKYILFATFAYSVRMLSIPYTGKYGVRRLN